MISRHHNEQDILTCFREIYYLEVHESKMVYPEKDYKIKIEKLNLFIKGKGSFYPYNVYFMKHLRILRTNLPEMDFSDGLFQQNEVDAGYFPNLETLRIMFNTRKEKEIMLRFEN